MYITAAFSFIIMGEERDSIDDGIRVSEAGKGGMDLHGKLLEVFSENQCMCYHLPLKTPPKINSIGFVECLFPIFSCRTSFPAKRASAGSKIAIWRLPAHLRYKPHVISALFPISSESKITKDNRRLPSP